MFNILRVHGFKYMSWVQVVYEVKFMSVHHLITFYWFLQIYC